MMKPTLTTYQYLKIGSLKRLGVFLVAFLIFLTGEAQEVQTTVDTLTIRIGEQINYEVAVETAPSEVVVFPEGQTFSPLEVIESYTVDTLKDPAESDKIKLIKRYGLTQFDSGSYRIPSQKIQVGARTVQTDTFRVEVKNVILDTVNQGLYDIKPVIEIPKDYSKWWTYLLWILPIALAIGLFIWWLLHRNKKQKEAEVYIPPFEKALLTLQQLDASGYIEKAEYKAYYTVLTDAVRRYYDEKVYDHALESTTDELIARLELERDSGHIAFNPTTLTRLKAIFKRADLIKFARFRPPQDTALADRLAIEEIVKETKEILPPPAEEELLQQEDYRAALARKRERRLWLTGIGGVLAILLLAAGIGVAVKGYDEVHDFVFGNESRALAEGSWITSSYGTPPLVISTPDVLVRQNADSLDLPDIVQDITWFSWSAPKAGIQTAVYQFSVSDPERLDLEQLISQQLNSLEATGFVADLVKNEPFKTPNGAEGVKSFGSGTFNDDGEDSAGAYALFTFQSENRVQQVLLSWKEEDTYSDQIATRIIASIELQEVKSPN